MKFLFVIPTLANGGAERVVSVVSTALTEQGCSVMIVKFFEEANEYLVGKKVNMMNLYSGKTEYFAAGRINRLKKLRQVIQKEQPDYVIPFMFPQAQLTQLAVVGLPVTVIQSIRINPAVGPASKWKRMLRDRLVYCSECTFVQNEQQKKYFKPKYHKKIHVLYNPVPDELFSTQSKTPDGQFTVCAMGRLSSQKNFPLLIRSFAEAFSEEKKAKLQIYGEGEKQEELQKEIDSLGMSDHICLMGRTNDVRQMFSQTDCFVLSSDFEGMPNALIEAMACHVPCVSTDCPTGPADLIMNGENGFLVPVNDREAMVKALRTVYEMSSEERSSMAEKGRQTVRIKCAQDQIAKRMIAICEEIYQK